MADNRLDTQIEKLTQAIKLTQKLRASVTKVFTDLSDGFQAPKGDEKALLNKLQKSLTAVNDNLGFVFIFRIFSTHEINMIQIILRH